MRSLVLPCCLLLLGLAGPISHAAPVLDAQLAGHWPSPNGGGGISAVQGTWGFGGIGGAFATFNLSDPTNPRLAGHLSLSDTNPPSIGPVGVNGNYAYVGIFLEAEGFVFQAIDISDPSQPRRLGNTPMGGTGRNIVIEGSHAYVAHSSLQVFDLSDPANPLKIATVAAGNAWDVHISGHHAYVADQSNGLRIFDVRNPANPVQVGFNDEGFHSAVGVAVSGNYAYVTDWHIGFNVIDIRNPANPTLVTQGGTPTGQGLQIVGNTAYLRTNIGLTLIDISDPSQPRVMGNHSSGDDFVAAAVISGETAIVSTDFEAQTVDISDPASPELLGRLRLGVEASDACLVGDRLYVTDKSGGSDAGGLVVLDASDPELPIEIGGATLSGFPLNVFASGNLVYVQISNLDGISVEIFNANDPSNLVSVGMIPDLGSALTMERDHIYWINRANDMLHIMDASDPASPQPAGSYTSARTIRSLTFGRPDHLLVSGGHAWLGFHDSSTGQSGYEIVDVSNPASPTLVASLGTDARGIHVAENRAFLAVEGGIEIFDITNLASPASLGLYQGGGLQVTSVFGDYAVALDYPYTDAGAKFEIIDVSDPSHPTLAGRITASEFGKPAELILKDSHAFVPLDDLLIYDLSNTAGPALLGTYLPIDDTSNVAREIGVDGDHAFLMWADLSALESLDVTNPSEPTRLARQRTSREADPFHETALQVIGNRAYLADGYAGLHVYDVSDPSNPQRLGGYNTTGYVFHIFVAGQHAYLAEWFDSSRLDLLIVDISNPRAPQFVSSFQTPGSVWDVFVEGHLAYVADTFEGLQILDVRNPANPLLLGGVPTGDSAKHVVVRGTYAYVAAETAGMRIIDVSDPQNPAVVGSFSPGGNVQDVAVEGNFAYVAEVETGLHVVDISDPTAPRRVTGNPAVGGLPGGSEMSLTIANDRLYYVAEEEGLFIFDLYQPPAPLRLEVVGFLPNGDLRLLLHGPPGLTGRMLRSETMHSWQDWMPFTLGDQPLEIIDSEARLVPRRFYQATKP